MRVALSCNLDKTCAYSLTINDRYRGEGERGPFSFELSGEKGICVACDEFLAFACVCHPLQRAFPPHTNVMRPRLQRTDML